MKKGLVIILFLVTSSTFAQVTYLKVGATVGFTYPAANANFAKDLSLPPSIGLNLASEWPWGKRVTFGLNLEAIRSTAHWYDEFWKSTAGQTNVSISLVP